MTTAEHNFAALTERHRHELHVHCYRMLASFDDAEDAVQETFLRAWRGWASFKGGELARAWMYRIATNVCLDLLRRRPPPDRGALVRGGAVAAAVPGPAPRPVGH
ncbi:MAG TPA: sigma factor [Jatrophihabitans sp.]|nr:sigma factor [Jatrophihabitans sp.]